MLSNVEAFLDFFNKNQLTRKKANVSDLENVCRESSQI